MVIRILFFLLLSNSILAQNIRTFRIQFTDKNNSSFSLFQPEDYLSAKAILRRTKASIPIQLNDIPINQNYIDSILKFPNVVLKAKSKWFNTIAIETDSSTLAQINAVSFVQNSFLLKNLSAINFQEKFEEISPKKYFTISSDNYYGQALPQIEMLNGHLLHQAGFTGEGMTIAVLDAGFPEMNNMIAFSKLYNSGKILGVHNFVDDNNDIYTDAHFHGSVVMSCMGAELPYQHVGTAPNANYYLFITEDVNSEHLLEEDNWVEAAEFADSAGVDLINSSLGYTTFDDPLLNHSYADMNGNTTFISRGADVAASKGILVVNSIGNSGTSSWFYLGAPSDADSVLAIGAVDVNKIYAQFSSKGPSSDGDIKPNIVAQGYQSALVWPGGGLTLGSGTSFSSPIICGMASCLWQAHPNKTNMEIFNAIQQSASQYLQADSIIGNGIPNFWRAHEILSGYAITLEKENNLVQVFPNPFSENLFLDVFSANSDVAEIEIYDAIGKIIYQENVAIVKGHSNRITLTQALINLPSGVYILKMKMNDYIESIKINFNRP